MTMNTEKSPKSSGQFYKEYWSGNSRDGGLMEGDGYHFIRMAEDGQILEAIEYYETMEGEEVVTPMPELVNVNWYRDLGYDSIETLDVVKESEFNRLKKILTEKSG